MKGLDHPSLGSSARWRLAKQSPGFRVRRVAAMTHRAP
jgi:hypothetical protein